MGSYSKLLPYTCYELAHPWEPACSTACLKIMIAAFMESMRIYAVVYTLSTLVSKKKLTKENAVQILKNYFQSVCFLTVNGFAYIGFFCIVRRLFGHVNFLTTSWFPAVIASILAILIERPSRRSMLAVYVANVASECLFNIGVGRGYIKSVPRGEVILFVISMAVFGYFFKKDNNINPFIGSMLSFFVGKEERGSLGREKSEKGEELHKNFSFLNLCQFRHSLCPHRHSCASYISLGALKGVSKGYLIGVTLKLVSSLSKTMKNPSILPSILFNYSALKMGGFIGALSAAFRIVCCGGRVFHGAEKGPTGALAGGVAGSAMLLYSSPSVALYSFWKAIETVVEEGCSAGYLPTIPYAAEILYVFSTAYLFHVAVIEAQFMKPSYGKFLTRLTDGRFGEYNRQLLDCYGLESGKLQPWPKTYISRFLTEEFKEKFKEQLSSVN